MIGGCSSRSVPNARVGVGGGVLSSGGAGSGAASGCRESKPLGAWESATGNFVPSLGSLESLKEPGPRKGPKQGKGARKTPIYR